MEKNALARDFGLVSLLRFALPTVVTMVLMGLYTVTDTVFVSRFVSTDALSALNIVCPVINLIVGIGAMLASGGSAVIAKKMGAGEQTRAQRDFTSIVLCGVLLGAFIAILGNIFLTSLVRWLGASQRLQGLCEAYLSILLWFTPASLLQVLFQNLMVTAGRPGLGMALSLGAGAANVALDYLFLVPLRMGIAGSALGTGIGYLIPSIIGCVYFARGKGSLRFCRPIFDFRLLTNSCLNGASELVGQLAAAVTTFLFNAVMMRLRGENGVAAVTILIYTQFLLSALFLGFSMGVAPVLSYRYGSGDHAALRRVFRLCLRIVFTLSLLVFTLALAFHVPLVRVFAPDGSEVCRLAEQGFPIFAFCFLFCGLNLFTSSAFTALSNGKVSAFLAFLRTFGFTVLGLLALPAILGITGVWLAVPLAEGCTLFFSAACLRRYRNLYHF